MEKDDIKDRSRSTERVKVQANTIRKHGVREHEKEYLISCGVCKKSIQVLYEIMCPSCGQRTHPGCWSEHLNLSCDRSLKRCLQCKEVIDKDGFYMRVNVEATQDVTAEWRCKSCVKEIIMWRPKLATMDGAGVQLTARLKKLLDECIQEQEDRLKRIDRLKETVCPGSEGSSHVWL